MLDNRDRPKKRNVRAKIFISAYTNFFLKIYEITSDLARGCIHATNHVCEQTIVVLSNEVAELCQIAEIQRTAPLVKQPR